MKRILLSIGICTSIGLTAYGMDTKTIRDGFYSVHHELAQKLISWHNSVTTEFDKAEQVSFKKTKLKKVTPELRGKKALELQGYIKQYQTKLHAIIVKALELAYQCGYKGPTLFECEPEITQDLLTSIAALMVPEKCTVQGAHISQVTDALIKLLLEDKRYGPVCKPPVVKALLMNESALSSDTDGAQERPTKKARLDTTITVVRTLEASRAKSLTSTNHIHRIGIMDPNKLPAAEHIQLSTSTEVKDTPRDWHAYAARERQASARTLASEQLAVRLDSKPAALAAIMAALMLAPRVAITGNMSTMSYRTTLTDQEIPGYVARVKALYTAEQLPMLKHLIYFMHRGSSIAQVVLLNLEHIKPGARILLFNALADQRDIKEVLSLLGAQLQIEVPDSGYDSV